jgi:2-keto-4-pentenoate hydratase/2-oxohepta-3-ene-1,7-dioic acid hydratase in catechol pathway
MKLALATHPDFDEPRPVVRNGDDILTTADRDSVPTIGELLSTYLTDGVTAVGECLWGDGNSQQQYTTDEVDLCPPVDADRRLFCVGGSYTSHLRESNRSLLTTPHQWIVPHTSIIGPNESIRLPATVSEATKPAIELCAVIGEGGAYINETAAYDHIAGYTISNDVTARTDWPGPRGYKIIDTFSPVGPHIVTTDEVADPMDLTMTIQQNDETICTGSTAGHRFTLSFLVSYLSTIFKLRPGDIISTGDPGNVTDRLRPGSTVALEIEDIGILENGIIEESA